MIVPGSLNPHFLGGRLIMNLVISANTSNYNLRSAAIAAGWDTITPLELTCTVNSGVTVYSSSTAISAFDVGSPYPAGTAIQLINNGTIEGKGGAGGIGGNGQFNVGKSGDAGTAGGPAFATTIAISIINNGTIGGGGGGGGGGSARFSYNGGNTTNGASGSGGGGGQGNGAAGGSGSNGGCGVGPDGTAGTLVAAGTGGAAIEDTCAPGEYGGAGGNGGTLGVSGATGGQATSHENGIYPPGPGGAAGNAVNGNANITWLVTGTRLGALT